MRSVRTLLSVAALAVAVVPAVASASGPQPPYQCKVIWEELARTSPGLPSVTISRPTIVCYG